MGRHGAAGTRYVVLQQSAAPAGEQAPRLPPSCRLEVFTPSLSKIRPAGLPWMPYLGWWCLQRLGLLPDGYALYVVRTEDRVVHCTVVLPRYIRFPFMRKGDVQVGPVNTAADYAGQGIASAVLRRVAQDAPDRTRWYVAREENETSLRIARRAGFQTYGYAKRTSRLGLRVLGSFVLTDLHDSSAAIPLRVDRERSRFNLQALEVKAQSNYDWRVGALTMPPALRAPYRFVERWFERHAAGKAILDYGCGHGIFTPLGAAAAASITGIDVSMESIRLAEERAVRARVHDKCRFLAGDCERLPFESGAFDIVFSAGVFSCVDTRLALSEIRRVLKPGGVLLIVDTLGHNPLLNLRRLLRFKRGQRTRWELDHVVRLGDMDAWKSSFSSFDLMLFDIVTVIAAPFATEHPAWARGIAALSTLDQRLMRMKMLRPLAFKFVAVLADPIKE